MRRTLFSPAATRTFRNKLLSWFDVHKRDLPWRRTEDPYAIWVSEIMLQQTRVAAVLDHYAEWLRLFPTVAALAAAREDEVLAAWSGLGYYRRARFLHRGAKAVMTQYAGELPRTSVELSTLPGVGAYTSAAIASIAFGEVAAVVDGNVERVILRQAGCSEAGARGVEVETLKAAEVQALASQLIDGARPGDFNQAMMELGATVCLPRRPLCLQCPVFRSCRTRGEHATRERKPGKIADIAYALAERDDSGKGREILLQQRDLDSGLMPGLWELPELREPLADGEVVMVLRHAILQTNYRARVIAVFENNRTAMTENGSQRCWKPIDGLARMPLTGLAKKILLRLGHLLPPGQSWVPRIHPDML